MHDLEIPIGRKTDLLARIGEALGAAGISIEGGGMFGGVAHFLVEDGPTASRVLARAGLEVSVCRPVLVQRLDQHQPGQLGGFCRAMADAGVTIEVLYSDHHHQLIVVVDDPVAGTQVSARWSRR